MLKRTADSSEPLDLLQRYWKAKENGVCELLVLVVPLELQ